jgi:hypothetical protein
MQFSLVNEVMDIRLTNVLRQKQDSLRVFAPGQIR